MTCAECPRYVPWPRRAEAYAARCEREAVEPDPAYPRGLCLRSPDAAYPVAPTRPECLWAEYGE